MMNIEIWTVIAVGSAFLLGRFTGGKRSYDKGFERGVTLVLNALEVEIEKLDMEDEDE